jgi:hypothetical protein
MVAVGALFAPWWRFDSESVGLAIVIGLLLAARRFDRRWLPLFSSAAAVVMLLRGVEYRPYGLALHFGRLDPINSFGYLNAIGSPLVGAAVLIVIVFALFGDRFFLHRLRLLARADSRRLSAMQGSCGLLAAGIFKPELLTAGFIALLGGLGVLLRDSMMEAA